MENKLNIVLGLWNGPAMMGAFYKRALEPLCNVYTIGPAFGVDSDIDCHPKDEIVPLINKLNVKMDYYIQFYSKPDYFPPDLYKLNIPKAWYVYDLHLHFEELATVSLCFDYIFTYDNASKEKLLKRGIEKVEALPFSAEKEMYFREQNSIENKKYDVGFAGSVTGHPQLKERAELLERIGKKFNLKVENRSLVGSQVADFYQDCSIVFNQAVKNDINMRVSETMMSGRPLLTPKVDGIEDILTDGEHACIYKKDNIEDKITYLLNNPKEREAMALRGQKLAMKKYSYDANAKKMLDILQNDLNTDVENNKDLWLLKSAQFRYHWFRYKGDALTWLQKECLNECSDPVTKLVRVILSLPIFILKILESIGKGPYFQRKE
jgi:hypothetical protein